MKNKYLLIILFLLFPINIFAYSDFLIPGGESIGIDIDSNGLVIVGFYKVNNEYIAKSTFKVGDTISKINDINVYSIDDLANIIDSNMIEGKVNVSLKRNNRMIDTIMNLTLEDGIYKTGIYVKDSITGIGTLTYIDPVTKIYGALGHEILFNETNTKVEVRNGNILESKVNNITRSSNGHVGSKDAIISFNSKLGTIKKNTDYGIFGLYTSSLPNKEILEVSSYNSIKLGKATIYTVTENSEIKEYQINIIDKYPDKKKSTKAFSFEVTDSELLNITGGIVQGMSGSPIIQDNKIIGGVTHVLIDNVTLGYGIYIETMLKEGEK